MTESGQKEDGLGGKKQQEKEREYWVEEKVICS